MTDEGAVLLVPAAWRGGGGPTAHWVITLSLAAAVEQRLGHAWVLSPDGTFVPGELRAGGNVGVAAAVRPRWWRRFVPEPPITLVRDAQRFRASAAWRVPPGEWADVEVRFVWQRHEMFADQGLRLARALGRPLVMCVDALQVRESRGWGVRRPGWGRLLERRGELRTLRAADLVMCVSQEVADSCVALGVDPDRALVLPNGVDTYEFAPRPPDVVLRTSLGLDGRFVVGWTGSFRRFHGMDLALHALARTDDDTALLLVGDGQERVPLEHLAAELGIAHRVVFTGAVPFDEIPRYLSIMDAAVVLSSGGEFHYSPVKMREYLACGLAVVAHSVGELARDFTDGHEALLIPTGDVDALAAAFARLRSSPDLRAQLGAAGRAHVCARDTWSHRVDALLDRVGLVGT